MPDPSKSIRDGAIAPWNTPAYAHELKELLALAGDYGIPVDVPFRELSPSAAGVDSPRRAGAEIRRAGRILRLAGAAEIQDARPRVPQPVAELSPLPGLRRHAAAAGGPGGADRRQEPRRNLRDEGPRRRRVLPRAPVARLAAAGRPDDARAGAGPAGLPGGGRAGLSDLDRTLRTLSGGEARRVALTAALGSSLVNMLYVLDEPSIGLHPRDIDQLLGAIRQLRNRGNTVVVVEHEEAIIRAADQVVEIGPGAGERGGKVVFQGTPAEMEQSPDSLTGDYLAGRRGFGAGGRRRSPDHGWIRLAGAGQQPQERHRRVSAGRCCAW